MNLSISYGNGFAPDVPMRARVERMQQELAQLPQYEPETKHYFHAGMYCREVYRDAGVVIVGRVHRKEHFYLIVSGTVVVTTDEGVQRLTGPHLIPSKAGTKRAVYSETPTVCMTFHVCEARNVDDAERELVEEDPSSMFAPGNVLKNSLEILE